MRGHARSRTRTRPCRGRVMRREDPHVHTYDSHWPLHFVGYAFTSMLDLFRGDIDGQAQLIWTPQGSPSLPFTYLCYDSASLDLIDGIAINLRISCRADGHDDGRRYARTHIHIIYARTNTLSYISTTLASEFQWIPIRVVAECRSLSDDPTIPRVMTFTRSLDFVRTFLYSLTWR